MSEVTRRVGGQDKVLERVKREVGEIDPDRLIYFHLAVACLHKDDEGQYTLSQTSAAEQSMDERVLAEIQWNITQRLWDNAYTSGSVPMWSQPPRLLRHAKWYDLLIGGVLIGSLLGYLLGH